MPFKRCWHFEDNGSRKTGPNGSEMRCIPNCQFIHPSDPEWDRAPAAAVRGRGGAFHGGRGRGQSSFGPPTSGASPSALGQERGGSSGAWNDYMSGFDHNPRATSGSRGAPLRRSRQTRQSSGWGSSGGDVPGWGSGANSNENPSNGWSNESGASGEQASSSPWDAQASGWGSSGDGWGSSGNGPGPPGDGWGSSGNASSNGWGSSGKELGSGNGWGDSGNAWGSVGTDQGPGWGETSILDQGSMTSSATALANPAEPDAVLGGHGANGTSNSATVTTQSSWVPVAPASPIDIQESGGISPVRVAIPSIPTSRELDPARNEECGEDAFEPATPLASNSIKWRPPHVGHNNHFISALSDTDKMGFAIAVTLRMRELDAELSRLSALRKSRQVEATRAAKELLQNKDHNFTDARGATEAEHNFCSGKLTQPDFLSRSNVQYASATLGRENEQLERLKDWVARAETCLSHVRPPSRPKSPIQSNGVTSVSKLNQLKGRSESLAETILLCQDQQIYNTFLDHQTQDKMDAIVAAIIKNLDRSNSHLVSTSFIPLQKQGEMWQQSLQDQAEKFAQVLLQSNQLKKEQNNQSSFKQKGKGAIYQLQADIAQKKLQLQVLKEEIIQLHHTSIEQQQSSTINGTLDEYIKHIQEYIQRYIQTNATLLINAELSKAVVQLTAAELKTVEKVWKILQPLSQISLWLQHSDIYKAEEEMEIREIEESLLA